MGRPSFDKIVITLSEYYHTLKKIQDVDTECPELSEESEEGADRPLVFPPPNLAWAPSHTALWQTPRMRAGAMSASPRGNRSG